LNEEIGIDYICNRSKRLIISYKMAVKREQKIEALNKDDIQ
jgi:hypothetical protein